MDEDRRDALRKAREEWIAAGRPERVKKGPTHTIRSKAGDTVKIPSYTPREACARVCMECFCWDGNPKTDCTDPLCPLFPYRKYRRSP